MPRELNAFLRNEIERRNLSERELSRRAGLSITAVNFILKNPESTPTMETCIGLAGALDVPEMTILSLAGYGEVDLSAEIDAETKAFAVYLANLPDDLRAYALETCWAVTEILVRATTSEEPDGT